MYIKVGDRHWGRGKPRYTLEVVSTQNLASQAVRPTGQPHEEVQRLDLAVPQFTSSSDGGMAAFYGRGGDPTKSLPPGRLLVATFHER